MPSPIMLRLFQLYAAELRKQAMTKLSAGDNCTIKFGTTIEARDRLHAACDAYGITMAAMLRHFISDWTDQIEAWVKERDQETPG